MGIEANNMNKNEKIGKILRTFLEPDFKIRNDDYLNMFLTHLVGLNEHGTSLENETNEQLKEQFCQWIIEAFTLWNQKKVKPQATILAFALNLASQLSVDEQTFIKLDSKNCYEGLIDVANSAKDPTVTFGLVNLLCSFLEHKSGLQWVITTRHWTDVISLGSQATTMFIRKEAYQFVITLLEKTISFNKNFTIDVVGIIIKPLRDFYRSLSCDKNTNHTQIALYEYLTPTLDFVLEVIDPLLRRVNKKVLHLFLELETPDVIIKLILLSQNEDFSFKLLQIQYVFLFYNLTIKLFGIKMIAHNSISLFDFKIMDQLMEKEMDKSNVKSVIKICDYAHELFCCLAPNMPIFKKKENIIEFQMKLIFVQMAPFFAFTVQTIGEKTATFRVLNEELRIDFTNRWIQLSLFQNVNMCRRWINKIILKPDLIDDIICCLHYIKKMKKMLNKERAPFVFAALAYSFSDALFFLNETSFAVTDSYLLYLKMMIDHIIDFVVSFDLTWKDSVETIRLMDYAFDLLQYPYWSDNGVVIQGLKLLNTAISKYMSPDMILLIYNKEDSKVAQTGSLLYDKCHDISWEIRNNALEVVHTLSLNAISKFPEYTNILLNAELPQLVVYMAFKDDEHVVRATAFQCLQEMIQIPEVWDIISDMDTFLDNLSDVFENETEGIVRKEAATLIYKIEKFQSFPEDILPRLFDVMTHAAIADLHWEVRYTALDFWCKLWEELLVHQGMLDRTFPSHTFSKELNKIVTLNETEIRKRIIKVLNELAHKGCLHVMRCAVMDNCSIEVSKKATSFTVTVLKMFTRYKIHYDNMDLREPPSSMILENKLPNRTPIKSTRFVSLESASFPSLNFIDSFIKSQFFNSSFFDTISLLPASYSASPDHVVITPPESTTYKNGSQSSISQHTRGSPLQNRPLHVSPGDHQASPSSITQLDTAADNVFLQASSISIDDQGTSPDTNQYQQNSPFLIESDSSPVNNVNEQASPNSGAYIYYSSVSNSPFNQITSSLNLSNGTDMFDDDVSFGTHELENLVNSSGVDRIHELLLEELLNSNNMAVFEGTYIPTDKVSNNTIQIKTKKYLAPSQYLKFVYEVGAHAKEEKVQKSNSQDEFDSLLNDILKEYNIVKCQ